MNQKNSPTSVVGMYLATPGRAWFDRSFPHLASYPIGKIVPDACIPLTGNTTVKLDITSMLQTNPTPTPVFDSCKCDVYVFFCPQRNYVRGLQNDNYLELNEIESMRLPSFPNYTATERDIQTISYGSLLHRLGMPASVLLIDEKFHPLDPDMYYDNGIDYQLIEGGWNIEEKNMSAVLAYYDACMYFLANPYDPEIPFDTGIRNLLFRYDDALDDFIPRYTPYTGFPYETNAYHNLRDLQNTLSQIRGIYEENMYGEEFIQSIPDLTTNSFGQISFGNIPLTDLLQSEYDDELAEQGYKAYFEFDGLPIKSICNAMQRTTTTGLFPATYMEDFQSTWFDNKDINTLNSVPLTITGNNTVQSARIQKSIWNRMLRSIIRGKKLTDWMDIQFGAKLKLSNHPIMVGMDSFNITWDDILSHSANNGINGNAYPLGGAAGRGKGGNSTKGKNDKTITFTTQEPGYLLIVRSIRPYVSYANNMARHWDYEFMADFPLPMYSGTQFQDLTVQDITTTNSPTLNSASIGKQPLYYDYMTGTYSLGGLMSTNLYDSYVFKRAPSITIFGDDDLLSLEHLRSTYILRENYDFQFTDWSQNNGENIFIKSVYNLQCYQPLDKQVTKTRL